MTVTQTGVFQLQGPELRLLGENPTSIMETTSDRTLDRLSQTFEGKYKTNRQCLGKGIKLTRSFIQME